MNEAQLRAVRIVPLILLLIVVGVIAFSCVGGDSDDAALNGTEVVAGAELQGADDGADTTDDAADAPKDLGDAQDDAVVVATATPRPVATLIPTATPLPTIAPPTPTPTVTPQPERTEPAIRPPGDWNHWVLTAKNSVNFVPTFDGPDGNQIELKYEYLNGNTIDYPLVNPTYFGNDLVLSVVEGEPGDQWVKVQLPVRPQNTTAWVQTDLFEWSESNHYVEIDISTNIVRVWNNDELIAETKAVTGSSTFPTPLFSGYIDEKVPDQGAAYGPWVLTLANFSEAHNTFGRNNALPKIALHGTNNPGIIGSYASNGCIRVPNDVITFIAENVPTGTRVDIVRS